MEPDDLPKPKPVIVVGQPLDDVSLDELQHRITALEAEILRIKAEITRKQVSKAAADAIFKS